MRIFAVLLLLLSLPMMTVAGDNIVFDKYFFDATMRIDYNHMGDAKEEFIAIDRIYEQGIWAGSLTNLLDKFNNGRYYVKVFDAASKKLIFSKGFDSYFGEYKTTGVAAKGVKRNYHESALIPYPKNKIIFTIHLRQRDNELKEIFSQEIDPADVNILHESLMDGVKVFEVVKNGDPHKKVDLLFVCEGYTYNERKKVPYDLDRFTETFFKQEPYKSMKDKFNVWGVYLPSDEAGVDEPRAGIYRNTAVNATFNSLGSSRYLLTEDNKRLRDIAAHAPYDTLLIMVNHKRYGGGGIYNSFMTFTTDNQWREYLLLHEFGHHFAGLADEYYSSSTAYNEFYPRGVEPVEPNITRLMDPANIKWKDQLSEGIEVPTPWDKETYDKQDAEYQKIRAEVNAKIAKLKKEKASNDEITKAEEESEKLSKLYADKGFSHLKNSKYWGKVGAFEGAGYSSKGMFRSMIDCMMFTKGMKPYCKVCEAAIIKVIKHYSE